MVERKRKHGFRYSVTLKILCGLVLLFFLGLLYNWVVDGEDVVVDSQEEVEEQQRKASLDTIDIVGDYLWPRMKSRKEDMMTDEERAKAAEAARKAADDKAFRAAADSHADEPKPIDPVTEPAPATVPTTESAAKPSALPTIEKAPAPRVETIEQ